MEKCWLILMGRAGNNIHFAHFCKTMAKERLAEHISRTLSNVWGVSRQPVSLYLENVMLWLEHMQDHLVFMVGLAQ